MAIGALLVTRVLPDGTEAKLVDLADVAIVCLVVVDAVVTLVVIPTSLIVVVVLKTFDVATLFVIVAIVVGWTEEEATTDAVSKPKKKSIVERNMSCIFPACDKRKKTATEYSGRLPGMSWYERNRLQITEEDLKFTLPSLQCNSVQLTS